MDRRVRIKSAIVAVLLLAVIVPIVYRLSVPAVTLKPGQNAVYDDFGFSAMSVRKVRLNSLVGNYYIVDVRVTNMAKRVPYTFKPECVTVTNNDGKRLDLSTEGQSAYELSRKFSQPSATIAPGSSARYRLVIKSGINSGRLIVRFGFGNWFTRAVDVVLYGKPKFDLEVLGTKAGSEL